MRAELERRAVQLGISDNVIFYGLTDRVNEWLQAADIFVMPSSFEGFGIAALEAQAAGLPSLLSDRIPREVKVTDNVSYLTIDDAGVWVKAIREIIKRYENGEINRAAGTDRIRAAGYTDDCIEDSMRSIYEY